MMIPNKVARVFTKEKQKLNSSTITKKIIERKLKKKVISLYLQTETQQTSMRDTRVRDKEAYYASENSPVMALEKRLSPSLAVTYEDRKLS